MLLTQSNSISFSIVYYNTLILILRTTFLNCVFECNEYDCAHVCAFSGNTPEKANQMRSSYLQWHLNIKGIFRNNAI